MRKIKTSLSLEPGCVARLKRLAQRERRSVSQLIDFALEQLLPLLEHRNLDLDLLPPVPAITFPKSKEGKPAIPSENPPTGSLPHSALRVPSSALSIKAPAASKSTKREATR